MMDLRNKNCRTQLIKLLDKGLKNLLQEKPVLKFSKESLILKSQPKKTHVALSPSPVKPQRNHSRSDHVQFFNRTQSQLDMRNERLQQSQERLVQDKLQKEIDQVTFHPQINKYSQKKFKARNTDEFYQMGLKWVEDKNNHIENLRESAQLKKQIPIQTFVVQNKTSEKILKKNQTDFYQRLSHHQTKKLTNLEKIRKDTTPSFKPQINKSSLNIQSHLNKDLVQIQVDLQSLMASQKVTKNKENIQSPKKKSKESGHHHHNSIQGNIYSLGGSEIPSFRQERTLKKEPRHHTELCAPLDISEMMYEYLTEDQINDNQFYN